MRCPNCNEIQPVENSIKCQYCGIVFQKWYAIHKEDSPPSIVGNLSMPETIPSPSKESIIKPIPLPTSRALLETSATDILAFRVDKQIRTLFGVLIFFVEPSVNIVHKLISRTIPFSSYALTSLVCTFIGIYVEILASKGGYSGILTAGGAGLLGGTFRASALYILVPGTILEKVSIALPILGIYSFFTLLGGISSWSFRKCFGIKLNQG